MQTALDQITQLVSGYVPNLLGALAILVVGWVVALIVSVIVRGVLRRTTVDNRLSRWIAGEEAAKAIPVEEWIAKGVFYLVMLFVLVAFFQALGLTLITEPLNRLLTEVFDFAPRLLGAGILLLVAWIVATFCKLVIKRVLGAARLEERLGDQAGLEAESRLPLTKPIADGVYWLVFLLFLPAVLGALALEGLLEPVQGMFSKALGFLPNIFTAGLILAIGWFIARVVERIVTNLLAAVGTNRLSERVGLAPALGKRQLSGVLGMVVYVLILIPILTAALNALGLEAITEPASNMLNTILTAFPSIFAAALIVGIAYVVGRVVMGLISNLLTAVGFDTLLDRMGLVKERAEGKPTPSGIVASLALVAIMFFAIMEAFRQLTFVVLADLMAQFAVFAGHIILGLVIFALGLYLANLASKTIQASGTTQAGWLALTARLSILALAGAMALGEIGVAKEIITLAFGLLFGAIAVAVAIAFGLGGREVAASQLEAWMSSMQSKKS
jgi:hypothetical protein